LGTMPSYWVWFENSQIDSTSETRKMIGAAQF
jgi:hypothetical protein